MTIAITDDHRALGTTASDLLLKRDARGAARALLEAPTEELPDLWPDIVELGWLGVHLPEAHGGSGFGLEELVVIVEELGRGLAPGPFVPTVITSAVIAAVADEPTKAARLPGLADGSTAAGVGLDAAVEISDGTASGTAGVVLGGGVADLLLLVGDGDVVLVDAAAPGVTIERPENLDPTRRSARVTLDKAPVTVLAGAAGVAVDLARVLLSAEAVG